MRVKAVIAYDGSRFFGYQSQTTTTRTVAGALQRTAQSLGIESPIVASGRTDRGVHATGQVIHFDVPPHWQTRLKRLRELFNRRFEGSVRFKHITPVDETFHARFDARRRIYRYLIKQTEPSPFEAPFCHYLPALDLTALRKALSVFEGEHDFNLFHKTGSDPASTIRTIYRAYAIESGRYVRIYFEANGFLRGQVRLMTATALAAAEKKVAIEAIKEQLKGQRRFQLAPVPPNGLYLARVLYTP